MARIKIVGLGSGDDTPFDGKYLAEYDPKKPGVDPDGAPMTAHVVCTDDPEKALIFADAREAILTWQGVSGRIRPDGKPDRPLTAFTVEIA